MNYKNISSILFSIFLISNCATFSLTRCAGCRLYNAYDDPMANKLVFAAANGMTWRVESLVKDGANPNHLEDGKIPMLIWAICAENVDGFEALLKAGADPNLAGNGHGFGDGRMGDPFSRWESTYVYEGWTAMVAAATHPDPKYLKLAIQYGGDLNSTVGKNGLPVPRTPLINAAFHGLFENVKILVVAGADINVYEGENPENPIRTVARTAIFVRGRFDIAVWCLENGYTLNLNKLADDAEGSMVGNKSERQIYKKKLIDMLIERGYEFPRPNGFVVDEIQKREIPESEVMNIVYGYKSWHEFPEKPKKMPWDK